MGRVDATDGDSQCELDGPYRHIAAELPEAGYERLSLSTMTLKGFLPHPLVQVGG